MGTLDRIFRRNREDTRDKRTIPNAPNVTAEQQAMNRDVMERQMAESRAKMDAERGEHQ